MDCFIDFLGKYVVFNLRERIHSVSTVIANNKPKLKILEQRTQFGKKITDAHAAHTEHHYHIQHI